ncbi:MAG: hypothetical protein WKF96_23085 [Solirubrobacteraceae bacterium]
MELTAEMRQLLAEAALVSEVQASWVDGPKLHSLKQSDMAPGGSASTLAERFARDFESCRSEVDQRRAIDVARSELEAIRRTPQPARGMAEPGTLAWKREIAAKVAKAEGTSEIKAICRFYSVSKSTAYQYRRDYVDDTRKRRAA